MLKSQPTYELELERSNSAWLNLIENAIKLLIASCPLTN